MGKHSTNRATTSRRVAAGVTAIAATTALTAGIAFGQGQANATNPQVTDGLATIHGFSTKQLDALIDALGIESQGIAGGQVFGPNYLVDELAELLNVNPSVIKGLLNTLGIDFGHETAIAILPGLALAIPLGEDSSAAALSILGIAAATDGVTKLVDGAWNVALIPGGPTVGQLLGLAGIDREDLPDDTTFCLGVFAAANSGTAGSCLNVLATFDARYNKLDGEVQLGLTNPLSVITLLTEPERLLTALANVITGDPIYLTKDFARLALNGPENLALTSDYGYELPVTISWLGSQLVLFPGTAKTQGVNGPSFVNYLSIPQVNFAAPTNLSQIIPTLNVPAFNVVDLFTIPAFNTADWLAAIAGATNTSTSSTLAASTLAAPTSGSESVSRVAATDSTGDSGAADGPSSVDDDSTPAPAVSVPTTQTPAIQTPATQTPETQTPATRTPETQTPATAAPEADNTPTIAPAPKTGESSPTSSQSSDTSTSDTSTSSRPDSSSPDSSAQETEPAEAAQPAA